MSLARVTSVMTALALATLGLVGCSGGGGTGDLLTAPGDPIPTTCTSADYAPIGYAAAGNPACLYHREVIDFSHPGVVVVYSWIQSLALAHLTAIGEMASGNTPDSWVKMRNGILEDSWDQFASQPIGDTGTTLADYFTADELEMQLVNGELRSIVYPDTYSIDEWNQNQQVGGTVTDGTADFTFTTDAPWNGTGEMVVIFAGPPTDFNGTVTGNTVTWTITGTEAGLAFHAVGPTA